jgi:sterol 3beta-glucosyltransferase
MKRAAGRNLSWTISCCIPRSSAPLTFGYALPFSRNHGMPGLAGPDYYNSRILAGIPRYSRLAQSPAFPTVHAIRIITFHYLPAEYHQGYLSACFHRKCEAGVREVRIPIPDAGEKQAGKKRLPSGTILPMRILLMTYGTRGDVEPLLALAHGFVKAGHAARLAGPGAYSALAKDSGVEYIPLPGNPEGLSAAMAQQAGGNPLRMIGVMTRFVYPLAVSVYGRLRETAPGADAIVHSFLLTHAGYEIARSLGVPDYSAQMFPIFAPTEAFSAPGFPTRPLPPALRKLTHTLAMNVFRCGGAALYGMTRRRHPEFPPLTGWPFDRKAERITPLLFGFSKFVVPRPVDWPDYAHITGYWQPDEPREEHIPAEVKRFLDSGPPPVFIGFGSYTAHNAYRLAETVRNAIKKAGRRGVFYMGGTAIPENNSRDLLIVGSIPYRWLFPRTSAVVHHGGAGTTGAGLRAGIPNVVIPFTLDQPFWAKRVRALGAGPDPIPLRRLTAERLAAAIEQALNDQAMQERCRVLGRKLDGEDGVARAVEMIVSQRSFP